MSDKRFPLVVAICQEVRLFPVDFLCDFEDGYVRIWFDVFGDRGKVRICDNQLQNKSQGIDILKNSVRKVATQAYTDLMERLEENEVNRETV